MNAKSICGSISFIVSNFVFSELNNSLKISMEIFQFFKVGEVKVELLEPTSPDSTIAKFIEKNGGRGGVHHIAFNVNSVEEALAEAAKAGIELIDKAPRKGAENLMIAFLHPKSTKGVLTEVCEQPK